MKYIKLFYTIVCFLIEIFPIKSEGKTITFSLKAYEQEKEYQLINTEFISYIKEIYINNEKKEPISSKINLTLSCNTDNIIKMVFNSIKTNSSSMFKDCKDIESINLLDFDISSSSNFNNMFDGCKSLKSIDLSFLKNAKIINMSKMFNGCSELRELDWSHLDLSLVIEKDNVFEGCINLESINFSYVNLTKISSLKNFFSNLISLKSIDLSNLIIPDLYDIERMFFNCSSLLSIDLSFINNSFIRNMASMFGECKSLQSIDFSDFHFLSNSQINMNNMFSNCTSLINANLSKLYIQNNYYSLYMNNFFSNCKALLYIDLSNVFISSSQFEMKNMFSQCSLLTSVDFTKFNSSSEKNMSNIFYKCISLKSIDLSTLTKINSLDNSFSGCSSLKSITFPDLKSVKDMTNMFYQCDSLISMDLSNFELSNLKSMKGMFSLCSSLITVNLENSNLKGVYNMNQMFYNCESLVFVNFNNITITNLENMDQMFYGCDSLISLDLSHINSNIIKNISQLFYKCSSLEEINLSNFNTSLVESMEQAFYDCSSLESLNLTSFNTSSVRNMKEMFAGCSSLISLDLSNFNFELVSNVENLFKDCTELDFVNIYNFHEINETGNIFEGVKDNLVFCIGDEGKAPNIINNLKSNNCKILDCSENYEDNRKKLLLKEGNNKKCLDKCYYDDVYKYELNKNCYETCPEGYAPNNITYRCEKMCQLIINFITKNDKECVYIFNSSNFYLGDYQLVNSNNNLILFIANQTINDIENGTLDFLLTNVTNENKEDYIIKEDKNIFQITSSYNQNNKEYNNISKLYLGECETILKNHYHIEDNETLIIFKTDIFVEGTYIPIIKFEIFHPNSKEKLNVSLCKNIQTTYPVSIDEKMLFKHDPTSDYYNDICYPYTTEKETDIVLYDRKNEYNVNNMSLCEKNCTFIEYNSTTKKVICECDIQNRSPLQLDDIINKEKLLNNFVNIETISNINLLKCYNILFSKDGLINNVGNYILLSIALIYIVSLFIFIIKGYSLILDKIKTIMKSKRLEKRQINLNNENETKNENNKEKEKEKENNENLIVKNPPIKKAKIAMKKEKVSIEKSSINLINSSSAIKIEKNKELFETQKNEVEKKEKKNELRIIKSKNDEFKEEEKTEEFSIYNDFELNTLSYENASIKDKRTFFQLLISLIKTKHLIIFTFFQTNDYNSQIIKICLFFFSFALYYAINGLFFNDETMHKIYEDEGIFNFIYFIPQIIYSVIISSIINILIKELSLSEKNITKIKQVKEFENIDELAQKVIKCLLVKFILFFCLSFLFLAFSWYYLSCFGAVYKNTQIILLKDTLISYSISLVYPFILYLLIALIRYPTLNKKEKCLTTCYKISQFIV